MSKKPLAALIGAIIAGGAFAQATGPSSSATPYITPTAAGWSVTSIITVESNAAVRKTADNGYKMVGIPDGLGAYAGRFVGVDQAIAGDTGVRDMGQYFTVLMNHELGNTAGIVRAHGNSGAFVSEWVIRKSDLRVISGQDLIGKFGSGSSQHLIATGAGTWGSAPITGAVASTNSWARLCSADLPAVTAFYNPASGLGTQNRIFMNGEETGAEGRAYGFVATGSAKGVAYQLPSLGRFSWENSVANPFSGDKTVVMGTDDSSPGQVYMYIGQKRSSGNDVQKAGLDGGKLYGISVTGKPTEPNNANPAVGAFTTPQLVNNAWNSTGAALQTESTTKLVTEFGRPEDGHWADARTFYFVTTGRINGSQPVQGKLYKVQFTGTLGDGSVDYEGGGQVSVALDSGTLTGTDGTGVPIAGFDNMTVTKDGKIIIQDDPGNSQYNAKTWLFDPANGTTKQIFESDAARFGRTGIGAVGATAPFNVDEENSGVIDITDIYAAPGDNQRYYLGVMQAHYSITGELVEGGQLYLMTAVPEPETYALMAAGMGLVGFAARRRKASR